MRSHSWLRFLVPFLALAACADLRDLSTLASALQQRYATMPNVRVTNGRHLAITFQNDTAIAKLDSAGRESFAREIARFSREHYPSASKLDDIAVVFATVSQKGPVRFTKTDAPFIYPIAELK